MLMSNVKMLESPDLFSEESSEHDTTVKPNNKAKAQAKANAQAATPGLCSDFVFGLCTQEPCPKGLVHNTKLRNRVVSAQQQAVRAGAPTMEMTPKKKDGA